jgi:glyoxylase-like metal-dependent hydrolase (beta-lactamase superfamily II)
VSARPRAAPPALPRQVHVFVRDWLSSNNVLLRSADGHVLIDTGYAKHVPLTLALVASRTGLDGDVLSLVVNTHGHSDHIGGNAALQRAYGCPIAMPEGEAALVDAWDERALLLGYAGQRAERFDVDIRLAVGTTHRWGDLDWEVIGAPGHAMRAAVFYNAEHRILVSGDALWHDGFGFVMPPDLDPEALPAARATLDVLASLDIATVIPGHGEPFTDAQAALERAYARLARLEADPSRMGRHAVKVILTFALLDWERIPVDDLPAFLDRVPLFADFNARYLHMTTPALAAWLVDELSRSGAAQVDDGVLRPRSRG